MARERPHRLKLWLHSLHQYCREIWRSRVRPSHSHTPTGCTADQSAAQGPCDSAYGNPYATQRSPIIH